MPLHAIEDPALRQHIKEKLDELRSWEAEIPAIFIVHSLVTDSVVYMSQRGLDFLGVTLQEICLPHSDYHNRFFNPEDAANYVPRIMRLLERNDSDEMVTFFQQVRPSEQHDWTWYLSSTRIFVRDAEGKPVLLLTMTVPIDSKHHITVKVERLVQENNFLRRHHHIFAALTKREKEILRLMALGHNSAEMAAMLHISETTVSTHRRNIKSKLNVQTSYDITRFAQAFDLV